MSGFAEKHVRWAASLAFAGLTVFLGYFAQRADFLSFIAAYGAFFGLYLGLFFFNAGLSAGQIRWYIVLGIALRVILLFSIPNFSDDIYRFLWDGRLTVSGIDPFRYTPSWFIEHQVFPRGITPELYGKLNSPEYFSVYPAICQAVFALAAWISPENEWGGVVAIKFFLLLCEAGTVWQLAVGSSSSGSGSSRSSWQERLAVAVGRSSIDGRDTKVGDAPTSDPSQPPTAPANRPLLLPTATATATANRYCHCQPPTAALWYAMNPLAIFEIVGNGHFEGAMIVFLVAGIIALKRSRTGRAAVWWALATASKLLPLMFLPVVWRRLGLKKALTFTIVFMFATVLLFAPLLDTALNIASSLDLYFRQFQFNASVYYLLGAIGLQFRGYEIGETIGPWLGIVTVAGVLVMALKVRPDAKDGAGKKGLLWTDALLFALMLQMTLSATVHPWYVTVPLALGMFTRWRFAIAWSGLAALSYSHYAGGLFRENHWLIALEYGVLWYVFYRELKKEKKQEPTTT